jgi:hypothetical protein
LRAKQDLAGLGESYYPDFPGNPRRVGCGYETRFKQYAVETLAGPTTYARVFVDPEREQLVLQFWLWYFFNDWNNTHESDWEMIQLAWDATSPEEALGDSLVFQLMVLLPGPLVGALLMLGGRASVSFANTLSSVVYMVSLPIAFIGLAFAYRRYQERGDKSAGVAAA